MIVNNKPYLIAETAFHHEGDKNFLLELIEHAAEGNADAVKFHMLLDLDDYMAADHDALEVLRPWCFGKKDWDEITKKANNKGLDVIVLCNDAASVDWAIETKQSIKAIELHATGLNDYFLLEKACKFNGTVILGVGGSTLDEIHYAIDFLREGNQKDIFLMYGFQSYPTDYKDINLSKMCLLQDLFKLPMGYADHTDPNDPDNEVISVSAAAMGFNVLEKHFTHHFGKKRIDAQAAVSLEQFKRIKELLNKVFLAFGNNSLDMSNAEKKYGNTGPMKKAIVARENIKAGTTISLEHVAFKRTNASSYLKQNQLSALLGLKASKPIQKDTFIDFSNVEFTFQKNDISQFHNTSK